MYEHLKVLIIDRPKCTDSVSINMFSVLQGSGPTGVIYNGRNEVPGHYTPRFELGARRQRHSRVEVRTIISQ